MTEYNLELDRLIERIKEKDYRRVLLQFPDGLKPQSEQVINTLQKEFRRVHFFIFFGSCYGACDIPATPAVDLVVQWGHVKFIKQKW